MSNHIYCLGSVAFLLGTLASMSEHGFSTAGAVYVVGSVAFLLGTLCNMRRCGGTV